MSEASHPRATYRVQLHAGFTLNDTAKLAPYLRELGVSHLYCSPYTQARPGSTHGYDVVDHSNINDELGGRGGLERLVRALYDNGLGHIVDIVPNHMSIGEGANRWWWDVLKNGPYSRYASVFDIDWDPPESRLSRTILMPVLGDHYGRVLDRGELQLKRWGDEVIVGYHEHIAPIPESSFADAALKDESVDETIARLNADPEALHSLLEAQHHRFAFWRIAGRELNYRRFFAINDLAGVRVERPEVFTQVHEMVLGFIRDGTLDGLRIDHIDGLRDPQGYLERLRSGAPGAYLVVEKILEGDERLPEAWPVEGTTGYEFLNLVLGLFIDPSTEKVMTDFYRYFTDDQEDPHETAREKKIRLMDSELAADVDRLTELFMTVCEENRHYRDFTRWELRNALIETIASFPVYRTYVDPTIGRVGEHDERYIASAVGDARRRRGDLDAELFDFLKDLLTLQVSGDAPSELAVRFQQATGAVMAKGIEDTFFYTYNRFVALNEVGGDPLRWGVSVERFHHQNSWVAQHRPLTMNATSTHDTKRSEDVRARLALLSEIPEQWVSAVQRWAEMNESFRKGEWPDRNAEYLIYQTLVGAWPIDSERIRGYALKAAREAKVHTSWIAVDEGYEEALAAFVEGVMDNRRFLEDLDAFVAALVGPGRINSLAQTVLKLTAPGIPDIYQGADAWDLSLVDPDNRRPVDFAARAALLQRFGSAEGELAWKDGDSGAAKLIVIRQALRLRARRAASFEPGSSYTPLQLEGPGADRFVAYLRGDDVAVIVPRLVMGRGNAWRQARLALSEGAWMDEFTGALFHSDEPIGRLLDRFPVALLSKWEV